MDEGHVPMMPFFNAGGCPMVPIFAYSSVSVHVGTDTYVSA